MCHQWCEIVHWITKISCQLMLDSISQHLLQSSTLKQLPIELRLFCPSERYHCCRHLSLRYDNKDCSDLMLISDIVQNL